MSSRITGSIFVCITVLLFLLTSCGERSKVSDKSSTKGKDTITVILEDLSKKIDDHPSNADLLQQRAKYYLLDHQEKLAFTDISKAITISPRNASLYTTLSDVYLSMGKPDNCNEALLKAIAIDPRNNPALIRLCKLSLIIKDYPATFDYVKKALQVEPHNPQAYFTRALALLEKGDTVLAVEDLKRTVDQDQKFYDAYVELGELYSLRKEPVAADYLKDAISIRHDSKDAMYMLGMFYQETGKYDDAISTYAKLNKIDSTFKDASYNTGYIYLVYFHDFKKAADYFTDALKRDPGYVDALFNRGYSYELAKDYSKAYQDYKHVLDLKVNYQKAIDGLNRLDKVRRR
jgi:tetratricopeptide (TPR) repeat protein